MTILTEFLLGKEPQDNRVMLSVGYTVALATGVYDDMAVIND